MGKKNPHHRNKHGTNYTIYVILMGGFHLPVTHFRPIALSCYYQRVGIMIPLIHDYFLPDTVVFIVKANSYRVNSIQTGDGYMIRLL